MKEIIITDYLAGQIAEARWGKWKDFAKIIFLIPAIIISGLAIAVTYGKPIPFVLSIGTFIFFLFAYDRINSYKKAEALRVLSHGKKGEAELRKTLMRGLGNEYHGFFGVPVNGRGDIDCIVVGPDSVFAIESKHHSGRIQEKDGDLIQIKVGRRGSVYSGNLNKPVRQLASSIHTFKEVLKAHRIDVWLFGILVFTNTEADLQASNIRNVSIVSKDSLCNLISTGSKNKIGRRNRNTLIAYLNSLKQSEN